jgi:hypothetical protein
VTNAKAATNIPTNTINQRFPVFIIPFFLLQRSCDSKLMKKDAITKKPLTESGYKCAEVDVMMC